MTDETDVQALRPVCAAFLAPGLGFLTMAKRGAGVLTQLLGLHLWWAATPVLVLQQLLAALILAQLLHALQLEISTQAQVDPFEVSLPTLVKLLAHPPATTQPLVPLLVERSSLLGLLRPSTRLQVQLLLFRSHSSTRLLRTCRRRAARAMPSASAAHALPCLLAFRASRLNF